MKIEFIILFSFVAIVIGLMIGLIISVFHYPKWEVRKVLKHLQNEGYRFGEWKHVKEFVDHHIKVIVKPNCETLYSLAFIQRKDGAYVLKMPAFNDYFSFAFIDENTNVLGYFTNRDVKSNEDSSFLIHSDDDEISNISMPSIKLNSKMCWIIGRFGVNKPEDIPAVNKIQDEIQLVKIKA